MNVDFTIITFVFCMRFNNFIHFCFFRERLHLPSTSRGILENCMNENTENLRIEVERQNRNEEIKEDISGNHTIIFRSHHLNGR